MLSRVSFRSFHATVQHPIRFVLTSIFNHGFDSNNNLPLSPAQQSVAMRSRIAQYLEITSTEPILGPVKYIVCSFCRGKSNVLRKKNHFYFAAVSIVLIQFSKSITPCDQLSAVLFQFYFKMYIQMSPRVEALIEAENTSIKKQMQ